MKARSFCMLSCLLVGGSVLATEEEVPPVDVLSGATVTIPFPEVRALLEKAERSPKEEAPPPVRSAITRAEYEIDLATGSGTANLTVATFGKGWQKVPIFDANLKVRSVSAEGVAVIAEADRLVLMSQGEGQTEVALSFAVPDDFLEGGAEWRVEFPPSTIASLAWQGVPAGRRLLVSGAAGDVRTGVVMLSSSGGELKMRLVEQGPRRPTLWSTVIETYVARDGAFLEAEARIQLTGSTGTGQSAMLNLPANASSIVATGADLGRVEVSSSEEAKTVALEWQTPGDLERAVAVTYRLPAGTARWEIEAPGVAGAAETTFVTGVTRPYDVRLTAVDSLTPGSTSTAPHWMRSGPSEGILQVYTGERTLGFDVTTIPRAELEGLRIANAEFETRIVADGALVCDGRLELSHRSEDVWSLRLPEGAELLAFKSGTNAQPPLAGTEGRLEVPLGGRDGKTPVGFSYTARNGKFDPVSGSFRIELPELAGFIETLTWKIDLPDGYEATALEGNVELVGEKSKPGCVVVRKRFSRGEVPMLEIFYSKQSKS